MDAVLRLLAATQKLEQDPDLEVVQPFVIAEGILVALYFALHVVAYHSEYVVYGVETDYVFQVEEELFQVLESQLELHKPLHVRDEIDKGIQDEVGGLVGGDVENEEEKGGLVVVLEELLCLRLVSKFPQNGFRFGLQSSQLLLRQGIHSHNRIIFPRLLIWSAFDYVERGVFPRGVLIFGGLIGLVCLCEGVVFAFGDLEVRAIIIVNGRTH